MVPAVREIPWLEASAGNDGGGGGGVSHASGGEQAGGGIDAEPGIERVDLSVPRSAGDDDGRDQCDEGEERGLSAGVLSGEEMRGLVRLICIRGEVEDIHP